MARVFLSYAREDARKAQAIAAALEQSGHQVWWDHHIEAGAEYSRRIADALRDAETVVVLWSRHSVDSPWVRDEATVGRDSGRLLPVILGKAEPPLGFRQYQAVAVSARAGDAAGIQRIVEAVGSARRVDEAARASTATPGKRRRLLAPALALLALVMAAAVAWLLLDRESAAAQPTLAVLPFADLSADKSQGHVAEGVAEEIMTLLSSDPDLRIVGRSSSWQLRDRTHDLRLIGATHILEGSVRSSAQAVKVTARLVDLGSGEQVWSQEYQRPAADIFAIQEHIGQAVADMLRGTFEAARELSKNRAMRTSPEVYNLFLTAQARTRERSYGAAREGERILESALERDPDYAPAHALMAMVQQFRAQSRPSGMGVLRADERQKARAHALRAIELAPNLADGHVALAMVEAAPETAVKALQRAIALDPGNFLAWNILGNRQLQRCRYRDAAASFRKAAAIEPLLRGPYQNLASTLRQLGRTDEAAEAAASFQSTARSQLDGIRVALEHAFWTGSIGAAVDLARKGIALQPDDPQLKVYLAYGLHLLGQTEAGAAALPDAERGVVGSYWKGEYQKARDEALRLGSSLWEHRFIGAAALKAFVWADDPEGALQAVERRWGSVGAFADETRCELSFYAPALATALLRVNRAPEAQSLLRRMAAEHRLSLANGYADVDRTVPTALLAAASGNDRAALDALEQAVAAGWLGSGEPHWPGLHDPVFQRLRSEPRFRALRDRVRNQLHSHAAELHARPREPSR